jgi:hypothetical protein
MPKRKKMNVNPVTVNIELKTEKQGKWYGGEKTEKNGDKTVSFYQRDGKRTFLQKIKDFKNGVRYGTELARKYSKELGLPEEAMSSVKNKSDKRTISNDALNTMFRTAHQKLQKNEFFKASDSLVSHTKASVRINEEQIYNAEDYKKNSVAYFYSNFFKSGISHDDWNKHISLAVDVRTNPSLRSDTKQIDEALDFFQK